MSATSPDQLARDYKFLLDICKGQIKAWREKAKQWEREVEPCPLDTPEEAAFEKGRDSGSAWGRRACADDLQWSLFILGEAPDPNKKETHDSPEPQQSEGAAPNVGS